MCAYEVEYSSPIALSFGHMSTVDFNGPCKPMT